MVQPPVLKIIIASTRPGRVGLPVAQWVTGVAEAHGGFRVEVIDLADVGLPMLDEPNHPRLQQYTHDHTKAWSATVAAADAFIIVMPEYNYGINAPLKNAIDYLFVEWAHKPVGLVSYGGVSGGLRAAQMVRQVFASLSLVPLAEAVPITFVASFLDNGAFKATEVHIKSAQAMLDALGTWTAALRPMRQLSESDGDT